MFENKVALVTGSADGMGKATATMIVQRGGDLVLCDILEEKLERTRKEMEALAGLFRPAAKVIAEFTSDKSADVAANESTILVMLKRRSCTTAQIAEAFGMHMNEVSKYVGKLLRTHRIRADRAGDDVYYAATGRKEAAHADV